MAVSLEQRCPKRGGSTVKTEANKTKQKGIDNNSHANYFLILLQDFKTITSI